MPTVPGFVTSLATHAGNWTFRDDPGVLQLAPPLVCIKVHGRGRDWWDAQAMPDTWTVGCTEGREHRDDGRHLVYELADGFYLPLASIQDDELDTVTRFFTRVPPTPSKYWVSRVRPARLDSFPDIPGEWLGTHTPWMAVYETRYDGGEE